MPGMTAAIVRPKMQFVHDLFSHPDPYGTYSFHYIVTAISIR